MATTQDLFSGFGGQGILFAGKFMSYKGLIDGKNVSWLPSYGPEMRGGTASCSVVIRDKVIGSPIVAYPDTLIAMNLPSLDKFETSVQEGGTVFIDSTLVERKVKRTDINAYYVPATRLANENNMPTLANMILVGKILAVRNEFNEESIKAALGKVVSAKHADLFDVNLKALKIGASYKD